MSNGYDHRIAGILKSIDEKLGRIADALEKSVVKEREIDLSGLVEIPVVEEWSNERIIEQFMHLCSETCMFIWKPSDQIMIGGRHRDKPGIVEMQVRNVGRVHHILYDYINNKFV